MGETEKILIPKRVIESKHELNSEELNARLERNRGLARQFAERAEGIRAGFSILLYGSTAYGYNAEAKAHSDIHDVDIGLIIGSDLSADNFLEQARYVFGPELRVREGYLEGLVAGKWDMCRMYGKSNGIDLEFFIMRVKTFRHHATDPGSKKPIRDVGDPDLRIPVQKHWSIRDWKPFVARLEHKEETREDESRHMIVKNFFLSEDASVLGSIGVPLLQAISLYDPSTTSALDTKVLKSYWQVYVDACLAMHPSLSNEMIIASLVRSDRFSQEYWKMLSDIIDERRYSRSLTKET